MTHYSTKGTLVTELHDLGRDGKEEHNALLIREEKRKEKTNS
jgi:hypothetical protein